MALTCAISLKQPADTDAAIEREPRSSSRQALARREEKVIEQCEAMIDIVAALYSVPSKELRRPGRGGLDVCRVRQIAMYVAHVVFRFNMSEVGRGFGRDRTTVIYACHTVEDLRDDEEFDRLVALAERVAMAAFRNRLDV